MVADPFLYERVYNYVLEEIRAESLKAGDRVPSEQQLAEQFGVSRITTKRALQMLADAGVVDRRRGRGSFVVERVPSPLPLGAESSAEPTRAGSCLAFVFPDASDAYGRELLYAIEERCAELGYHLIVRRTLDRQDVEEQAIEALHDGVADGLIVFPVHGDFYNPSLVRLVLDHAPVVLVDRHLSGIPACSVYTDNVSAARTLTKHLLDLGHHRVAFCSPPVDTSSIEERMRGYELALRDHGLAPTASSYLTNLVSTLPRSATAAAVDADRAGIAEFGAQHPDVTAFIACEYNIAVLLREAGIGTGRSAGEPALIACFDSPSELPGSHNFIHIRQDQQAMGRAAVDLLVAQLHGEPVPLRTVIPFSLVGYAKVERSETSDGEGSPAASSPAGR